MTIPSDTRRWFGIAAWIVATGLLVFLFRTVDVSRVTRVLATTHTPWLIAAIASNLLIQPFGAMQWRALLPAAATVPAQRMLRLFSLTSVANNTTPALIGHATGTLLVAAEPKVGTAAALSMMALDQLAVGLVKIGILLAAAGILPLPDWMRRGLLVLALIVGAMLAGAVIVARRTQFLEPLREPARFARGVGFAIAVKLCEAGGIFAVQRAFGLPLSAQSVLLLLAANALASAVPVAPASIGTYEAAAYAAYRWLGLAPEAALGIAVVQHVCQLLPAVGAGYLILSLPKRRHIVSETSHASLHED